MENHHSTIYRVETGRIEPLRRKCALYRKQQYLFFHAKTRQCVESVHDIFHISSFSPSSSNSSSPSAVVPNTTRPLPSSPRLQCGKSTPVFVFTVFHRLFSLCYSLFLLLITCHPVAEVVCPVAVLMYSVLGEIYSSAGVIHSVAAVVCQVAGVIYSASGGLRGS